jgi:diguanylate cyclase (GGDEF)-like protein/PAS domain S-box-containing protein
MLGDPPQETRTTLTELFLLTHPSERETLFAKYAAAVKGHSPEYRAEHRIQARSGQWKWILSHGKVMERAANGFALRMIGTNVDITERKRAEDLMRESEQRFRDVVDASGEYVWETDAQWHYRYLSKRAEYVLGHPMEKLLGHMPAEFMPPGEAERVSRWIGAHSVPGGGFTDLEHMTVTEAGEIRWQCVSCKPVPDEAGNVVAYRGTGANITERKRHEAHIEQLATRDALTGLPNRALLHDRLAHAIAGERRERGMLATMFIDIDRFKTINDSLGHHIGDALLRQMAMRLLASVREEDTVARSGGDEFVVVAGRMNRAEDASQLAGRFCPASMRLTSSKAINSSLRAASGSACIRATARISIVC